MQSTEVRIGGFGGQGVVLAGGLLGEAALCDGLYAIQNQSYGAEARGGAARSEILLAADPILYPEVIAPHILVAMSQAALERYLPDLRPEGTLIIDTELVAQVPERPEGRILGDSFTSVADKELGRAIVANMVMLGFVVGCTQVVGVSSLRQAVAQGVPQGTEELNISALERGLELAA